MSNQENEQSSNIGSKIANSPRNAANKAGGFWRLLKGAKVAVLFLKKVVVSLIGWLLALVGPYVLIALAIIFLLLLILDSVRVFDIFQEDASRTEAAVIFDESVKAVMEDYANAGPNDAVAVISETQSASPYLPVSPVWLENASSMLKQSIAVPTIHHYFKNIEKESYRAWHKDYENDDASNPEALKEKYKAIIKKELEYYFESMAYEAEYTWTKSPGDEYIETVSSSVCTHIDEEGNTTTTTSGPKTSKKNLPKRDIVESITLGYTKGTPAYTTVKHVTDSTSVDGDCVIETQTTTVLYVIDEAMPMPVEFQPDKLVRQLILEAAEGDYTQLVQVQDLEYAIDMGKEIDEAFPLPEIDYSELKSCVQAKNADVEACIDEHVTGGSFALGFGGFGLGSYVGSGNNSVYPLDLEPLYMKYAELAGIDWHILAAVHFQESTFSANPVAYDESKGSYNSRGEYIGAVGHFQFVPATWVGWAARKDYNVTRKGGIIGDLQFIKNPSNIKKYGGVGRDGNNDGVANPWDVEDAMYSAALYLKSYGYVKGNESSIKTALAKYNGGPTYYVSGEAQKYAAEVWQNGQKYLAFKNSGGGSSGATGSISVAPGAVTYPTVGRFTSGYGMRAIQHYGYKKKMHYGIDIANSPGTPIVSVADGVVVKSTTHSGWGNYVMVEHNVNGTKFRTLYAHMRKVHVRNGMQLSKGALIGEMGKTGSADGVHLHFEVYLPPFRYPTDIINPTTLVPLPPK